MVFARCMVVGGSLETSLKLKQVDPPSPDVFEVSPGEVFNANDLIEPGNIDEIGHLPHTNVACVLSLLRERYSQGLIYTTADPLLVAINPFKDLGNTTDAWIAKYRESAKPETLPSHVFKTARAALENLHSFKKNQTIIVSGESGAGKTEATKQVMRYFAAASEGGDNKVQQCILAGNPVLEAFGNAKTIRNNNSSRFGRFVMLELSVTEGIVCGMVSNFLLEKVRVVSQEANERSYHIFYQLLKGADAGMRDKFHLRSMQDYVYLNRRGGGCYDVPSVDDQADFAEVVAALGSIGLSAASVDAVFSILSGLLLIGNVNVDASEVQGVPDAAVLPASSEQLLQEACDLMYIDTDALRKQLLTKSTKVGALFIEGVRTKEDALVTMLSLSKNMYDKLFDWIVKQLNQKIQWTGPTPSFIGILDIFGFEVLEVNSLEQVLINVTNEYLQKHFIDVVFENETKLYKTEGIPTAELTWTDNQALVRSLCGKKDSFFALLEDTCLGVKATDEGFCGTVVRRLKVTGFFSEAVKDKRLRFVVRHTIADIEYTCEGMLEKNKDFLRKEVMDVINASRNPVTCQLFEGVIIEAGKIGKGALIASRFLKDLEAMLEVIRVGYAYRRKFNEFCEHFKWLNLGGVNSDRDRRDVAIELLQNTGLPPSEWAIGKSMVFIKPDAAKKLALMQRERLSQFAPLVHLVEPAWKKIMLRRELAPFVASIVRLQSYARRNRRRLAAARHVRRQLTEDKVSIDPHKPIAGMSPRKRVRRAKPREAQLGTIRGKGASTMQRTAYQTSRPTPSVCVASSENLSVDEIRSLDTDYFLHLESRRPPNERDLRQRGKSKRAWRGSHAEEASAVVTHVVVCLKKLVRIANLQQRLKRVTCSIPEITILLRSAIPHSTSRQPPNTNMEQAVHIWKCVKTLLNAPLSERRLQNICTVIRNDLDKNYGHFWQVVVNRTDHFGIAPTHIRDSLHVVEQTGIYRDGRTFRFHFIIYKARRPVKAEIRLHEKASERTYEICRRRDFSGSVRVLHSKVPHYLLKDVSYLFGMLFQRYQHSRDWTAYAVRIQSYLMGRLWTKHSRFLRVELDFNAALGSKEDGKTGSEPAPRVLTVVCFEACCCQ